MRMRLELEADTRGRLAESATRERRHLPWQVEVLLQRAVRGELHNCRRLQAGHTGTHERPQRQEVQR